MDALEPQSKRQKRDEVIDLDIVPLDTELVVQSIQPSAQSLHGITFLHQVYATMRNRSIVDEEIAYLRSQRSIKCLQCSLKQPGAQKGSNGDNSTTGLAIIATGEYISSIGPYLRKAGRLSAPEVQLVGDAFGRWVASSSQISTSRRDLLLTSSGGSSPGLDDVAIEALIHAGFLTYRNNLEVSNYALGSSGAPSSVSSASSGVEEEFYWLSHPALR
jgi:hypothetical protein